MTKHSLRKLAWPLAGVVAVLCAICYGLSQYRAGGILERMTDYFECQYFRLADWIVPEIG